MKYYYHLTSYVNTLSILRYGFKPGNSGWLGPGIYFAFCPKDTFDKAQCKTKNAMIIVLLNAGKLLTAENRHWGFNMMVVKSKGYDSVQKLNCNSGPEICVYEPHRVKIIGYLHWDNSFIEFSITPSHDIKLSDFYFLTKNRKIIMRSLNGGTLIRHVNNKHIFGLDQKCTMCGILKCQAGFDHEFGLNNRCKMCGILKCQVGLDHVFGLDNRCKMCHILKCQVDFIHVFGLDKRCKMCGVLECQVTSKHDFGFDQKCKMCGILKCQAGFDHDFGFDQKCKMCGILKCQAGFAHDFGFDNKCKMCGIFKCQAGFDHDFGFNNKCKMCNILKCQAGFDHDFGFNQKCKMCVFVLTAKLFHLLFHSSETATSFRQAEI